MVHEDGRLRVLAFAFACDPERGSEAAGAWGMVTAMAELADVTVLVNPVHLPNIAQWQDRNPGSSMTFVPVPFAPPPLPGLRRKLPAWFREAERMRRYWRWQQDAKTISVRLHERQSFDVAVHASLGMYWMPSVVADLPIPSVWGPVSGGAASPPRLWRYLGVRGLLAEWVEAGLGKVLLLLPAARRTRSRATIRLVESDSALRKLPRPAREGTGIVNRAILSRVRSMPPLARQPYLVFSSPLEKRKGPALALHAFTHTPSSVRFLFIHEGPEERRLRRLAARLGVAERVEFRGRVSRSEMWSTIAASSACVFAGLREEGGCALAEAMLSGAPVVVLGHGGARLVAEASTDPSRIAIIEPAGAVETARQMGTAMARFAASRPAGRSSYLDQVPTQRALMGALGEAISQGAVAGSLRQKGAL
jgi:glycosyltransferase involved in cell wall biosynthesis